MTELPLEVAQAHGRVLAAWNDDAALMAGCAAIRRMGMLRVGSMADHAEAFREAALAAAVLRPPTAGKGET